MCSSGEEMVDHLFFYCRWVSNLWNLSPTLTGVSGVDPHTIRDVLVA